MTSFVIGRMQFVSCRLLLIEGCKDLQQFFSFLERRLTRIYSRTC